MMVALLLACALLLLRSQVGAIDKHHVRRWSLSSAMKSAASRRRADFPALFTPRSKTGSVDTSRSSSIISGDRDVVREAATSSRADPLTYRGGQTATARRGRSSSSSKSKTAAQRRALTERAEARKKKTATTAKKNKKQQQKKKKDSTKKKAAAASATAATAAATTAATAPVLGNGSTQMPTLFFTADETDFDRYAACLAAAEGLRRARDASVKSSRVKRALGDIDAGRMDPSTTAGGSGATASNGGKKGKKGRGARAGAGATRAMRNWSPEERTEFDTLRAQYAVNTARMVQSLGLSVSKFNDLGKIVNGDAVLKERVMEQAYLYGMAAGLTGMERVPLIRGSDVGKKATSSRKGGGDKKRTGGGAAAVGAASAAGYDATQTQVETFARCLSEVEALRESNLDRLRASLGVDMLPPVICDPNVRSLLDPRVRAVCDAFPLQAEEVVGRFGLGSDEFNGLLDRLRSDPLFRWRVKRCMSKLVE